MSVIITPRLIRIAMALVPLVIRRIRSRIASLIVTTVTSVYRDSKVAVRKLSLRLPSGYRQQRVQIILLCSG